MKYLNLLLLVVLLNSCSKNKFVDIQGNVNGFSSGTVIIKNAAGQIKYTENIEMGKFHFHKMIDTAGYYTIRIIKDSSHDTRLPGYDIYLEPGNYTLTAQPESAHQYPDIKSTSSTQEEISAYYAIANQRSVAAAKKIEQSVGQLNGGPLSKTDLQKATYDMKDALAGRDSAMGYALQDYIAKYPQSHVVAHIMYGLNYDQAPEIYYPVYEKMSDEQKKSAEGAEEGDKFNAIEKLLPGHTAPAIVGNTIDGKPFDPKSLNKKLILVEFWKSDDQPSRMMHVNLVRGKKSPVKDPNLAMVSISLDANDAQWKQAVKQDGITWTQVSDLKGEASPNMANFQVSRVPTYFLLDSNWKIINRDIYIGDVTAAINKYMASH